jgi:hypothetical protein
MKQEKMSPYGSSSWDPEARRALLRAADQKKMNRYMAPSKKHDVRPRDRMRRSLKMVMIPLRTSDSEL